MEVDKGAFEFDKNSDAIAAMQGQIAQLQAVTGATATTIIPVEGGTYSAPVTDRTISIINAKPATDLNAITFNLPTGRIGQRLFFHSTRQIALVTFAMPGGSVDNSVVMLSPGDSVDFTYSDTNNWARGI